MKKSTIVINFNNVKREEKKMERNHYTMWFSHLHNSLQFSFNILPLPPHIRLFSISRAISHKWNLFLFLFTFHFFWLISHFMSIIDRSNNRNKCFSFKWIGSRTSQSPQIVIFVWKCLSFLFFWPKFRFFLGKNSISFLLFQLNLVRRRMLNSEILTKQFNVNIKFFMQFHCLIFISFFNLTANYSNEIRKLCQKRFITYFYKKQHFISNRNFSISMVYCIRSIDLKWKPLESI